MAERMGVIVRSILNHLQQWTGQALITHHHSAYNRSLANENSHPVDLVGSLRHPYPGFLPPPLNIVGRDRQ